MSEIDSESESNGHHLSCPICLEIFEDPKILLCGHSLCATCVPMTPDGLVVCPICREETIPPANGLKTNFALRDLVEESKNKALTHLCKKCNKVYGMEEMWSCSECNLIMICSMCAMKGHREHKIEPMSELLSGIRVQYAEWRQLAESMLDDIDSDQQKINRDHDEAKLLSQKFQGTLGKTLGKRFSTIMRRIDKFQKALKEDLSPKSNVDELILTGQLEGFIDSSKQLKKTMAKQRILKADMSTVLDMLQSSASIIQDVLDRMGRLDELAEEELLKEENQEKHGDHVSAGDDDQILPYQIIETEDEGAVADEVVQPRNYRKAKKKLRKKKLEERKKAAQKDDSEEEMDQSHLSLSLEGIHQYYVPIDGKRDRLPKSVIIWERSARKPKSIELCKLFKDQQIVIFCPSYDLIQYLASRLKKDEIPASSLDVKMDKTVRDDILRQFISGKFRMLIIPVDLAEHVDVQSIPVVINIGMASKNLYIHCAGRSKDKEFEKTRVVITLVCYAKEAKRIENYYKTLIEKLPGDVKRIL